MVYYECGHVLLRCAEVKDDDERAVEYKQIVLLILDY